MKNRIKSKIKDMAAMKRPRESKMKINSRVQTEYLLNNFIDKDFQSMLLPLCLVPSFFLMSSFSIINNFITPNNNLLYHIKSFVGTIVLLLSHYFRFQYYSESLKNFSSNVIVFLLYFDLIFFSLVSILTHIVNVSQRANIVELLIKLQDVLNCLKIDKADFLTRHKNQNWLSVLIVFSIYIVHCVSSIQHIGFLELMLHVMCTIPMLVFDMHVLNVTRLIVFIKNELLAWTQKIEEKIKTTSTEDIRTCSVSDNVMFEVYVNIIKAIRLCNKVYKFSFTYYGFQTFIHILITLELVIELDKWSPVDSFYQTTLMKFLSVIWNLKSFILLTVLSAAADNLYTSVKKAESSCCQILSNDWSAGPDMRTTCKNVLRLNRAALCKLSAFGVFELDAAFPLRLLSGLVTYTVVLLQFAFL